jgi:hypothetical protein
MLGIYMTNTCYVSYAYRYVADLHQSCAEGTESALAPGSCSVNRGRRNAMSVSRDPHTRPGRQGLPLG